MSGGCRRELAHARDGHSDACGKPRSVAEVVEPHQRPGDLGAGPLQSLVAVVAIVEHQGTVLHARQQRWRFPALVDALLHGAHVVLPFARWDGALDAVLRTGEPHEGPQRDTQGTE